MSSNQTGPILIKFGGEIVEDDKALHNLVISIKKLHELGNSIILVHGGGPLATVLSERLNITPQMVGGRRVTCQNTLEVMKMTLPGIINSNVLAMLKKFKLPGVAVAGISFVHANRRPPKVMSGTDGKVVDFGHVGDIESVDPYYLQLLLDAGLIPVVSPLCSDDEGNILNINADTVATQIAIFIKASQLVLITKVGGVFKDLNDLRTRFQSLSPQEVTDLISKNFIQGGMIPKLEEGMKLLESHMESFHICGVESENTLLNEIQKPGSQGTAIVKKKGD